MDPSLTLECSYFEVVLAQLRKGMFLQCRWYQNLRCILHLLLSPCPDRLDLEPPAKRLLTVQGVSFQGAFSVSFLQLDVSTQTRCQDLSPFGRNYINQTATSPSSQLVSQICQSSINFENILKVQQVFEHNILWVFFFGTPPP